MSLPRHGSRGDRLPRIRASFSFVLIGIIDLQTQCLTGQCLGLFNALCAVNALELALRTIVILQRLGLRMIGFKALTYNLQLIICTNLQSIAAGVAYTLCFGRIRSDMVGYASTSYKYGVRSYDLQSRCHQPPIMTEHSRFSRSAFAVPLPLWRMCAESHRG